MPIISKTNNYCGYLIRKTNVQGLWNGVEYSSCQKSTYIERFFVYFKVIWFDLYYLFVFETPQPVLI